LKSAGGDFVRIWVTPLSLFSGKMSLDLSNGDRRTLGAFFLLGFAIEIK
jgi:hypothetical protein